MTDISNMRKQFERNPEIHLNEVPDNPHTLFDEWFAVARNEQIVEPNGFVLATSNGEGRLRTRTVLLKYFDETGYVFFTNYGSQKAKDIAENKMVSACFPWYTLERQIMIDGPVERVSTKESLKYFSSRPRGSQIGAWVSEQSSVVSSRAMLMNKVKQLSKSFMNKDVPLPEFWGGYRIMPKRFEFWQGQPSRLHDRIEYLLQEDGTWIKQRLAP
ncbi:pyridoxamine 5'-phosphate oxidase [Balneicella halophila]|uniref:Pyridoxine/pyridoxamine 5'-phosphate oxidase n=1 Tax=Balneicella halophila TaxID=1537566 RepID=A0A7L4UP47_BALHA|nr:pyridoxamine 5'-phosphate oxidase [Balneicella halophila]PVX50891.1 pyridoxamine 5'-phosphate oxidase [Balneicella halophila]